MPLIRSSTESLESVPEEQAVVVDLRPSGSTSLTTSLTTSLHSNASVPLDTMFRAQSAPAPEISVISKEISNGRFSQMMTDNVAMSPFAARAQARALARKSSSSKCQSVPPRSPSILVTSPGGVLRKSSGMRSITDDCWTTVKPKNVRKSLTPSFKPKGFDKTVAGMTNQERIAAQAGRTKLCRHHLLGGCPLGDKCTLAHDISVMKPSEQKVFIGGIPSGCTSRQLIEAIENAGFKVINIPKCHPSGFAPKVCLESVEDAKQLLKIARIDIGGHTSDVRKFKDSRANNSDNSSVIVSGIPEGTTGYQLLQELEKQGFLIDRSPVLAAGATVCDRCEMATVEQADALVAVETLECLGTTLTFKPFSGVDATRQSRRTTNYKRRSTALSPRHNGSSFVARSPKPSSPISTFGGNRRKTFGSFMNRALSSQDSKSSQMSNTSQ